MFSRLVFKRCIDRNSIVVVQSLSADCVILELHVAIKGYGGSSFMVSASTVWNILPKDIKDSSSRNIFKS